MIRCIAVLFGIDSFVNELHVVEDRTSVVVVEASTFDVPASLPHFWQTYFLQSLQKVGVAPNTAPNFSPHRAQEQTQREPLEHRLPQFFRSSDRLEVIMRTLRFMSSNLSTSLPMRFCSDKSNASAL